MVATHDLRIGDDIGGGFTPKGAVMGFRARLEDGELVLRATDGGRRIATGWDALLDRLARLDRTQWHDLHVWPEWPAEEAIAMGQPFAIRELVPVLVDLAQRVPGHGVAGGGDAPPRHKRQVSGDPHPVPKRLRGAGSVAPSMTSVVPLEQGRDQLTMRDRRASTEVAGLPDGRRTSPREGIHRIAE